MCQAVKQLNEAVSSLPAEADCDALLVMPLYAAMPPDMQVSQTELSWLLMPVQTQSCPYRATFPVLAEVSGPDSSCRAILMLLDRLVLLMGLFLHMPLTQLHLHCVVAQSMAGLKQFGCKQSQPIS